VTAGGSNNTTATDRSGYALDNRGTVTVPGDYVQEHVGLAYAVTVYRSQGLTVDQAVLVVDRSTSAEPLYVGMTRGRHHNLVRH
jgi:ATP-dependent exoDNAse (exonuclease V) alpha subunit